eukprot:1160997-Pelagomonas_calceolata.AAC.4
MLALLFEDTCWCTFSAAAWRLTSLTCLTNCAQGCMIACSLALKVHPVKTCRSRGKIEVWASVPPSSCLPLTSRATAAEPLLQLCSSRSEQ